MSKRKFSKALPYQVQGDSYPMKMHAEWLRASFAPLMAKRLPTVLYGGFKQGFIPKFVQEHKKQYPFFLKVDIQKFYPSMSHHHLTVSTQLSYKKLLSMKFVPSSFKKKALPILSDFFNDLPISNYGLPLNSGISKALASLIYVPFFLDLKSRNICKFIVHTDDVLFLCERQIDVKRMYEEFHNAMSAVELKFNLEKVQEGRFSSDFVDFCGYRFAGGYVNISPSKLVQFKEDIQRHAQIPLAKKPSAEWSERAYIKKINQKLNGFGHYYKYGNVVNTFQKLDPFVRANIRTTYKTLQLPFPSNAHLENLGLRNLSKLAAGEKQHLIDAKTYNKTQHKKLEEEKSNPKHHQATYFAYLEKLVQQNHEIIQQLKALNQNQNRA